VRRRNGAPGLQAQKSARVWPCHDEGGEQGGEETESEGGAASAAEETEAVVL
jgi:hypothetical protein